MYLTSAMWGSWIPNMYNLNAKRNHVRCLLLRERSDEWNYYFNYVYVYFSVRSFHIFSYFFFRLEHASWNKKGEKRFRVGRSLAVCWLASKSNIWCIIHFNKENKYLPFQCNGWGERRRRECEFVVWNVKSSPTRRSSSQPMILSKGYYARWERRGAVKISLDASLPPLNLSHSLSMLSNHAPS